MKYCYEQELTKKPDLGGRIMVQFTIAASGQVIASVLQNSTMGNARVENCTVQAVRRWEFPKPLGGGIVIVSYPFVLTPARRWRVNMIKNSERRHASVVSASRVVLPACDGFVCSQERDQGHRARQPRRRGVQEQPLRLGREGSQAGDPDRSDLRDRATTTSGKVYQKQRKWDKGDRGASRQAAQRRPTTPTTSTTSARRTWRPKKLDAGREGAAGGHRGRPEAVQGLVASGPGLQDARPARRRRTMRSATPSRPTRASRKSYVALGYLYLDYDFNKEAAQVFQGCVTAKEDDGECHNGYGLALKNLKQYEQATSRVQEGHRPRSRALRRTLQRRHGLLRLVRRGPRQRPEETRPASTCRSSSRNGGKSADGNYVKAANDKLLRPVRAP